MPAALFFEGLRAHIQILQYLQYLPIFENALKPSADAGLRETPKWQFLVLKVAISRTEGGNFSKVGWQFLELVRFCSQIKKWLFMRVSGFKVAISRTGGT